MAHMNCVGVTCLTMVMPSGNFCSLSPYLAEMSFQVPTSLFSALESLFGFSATAFVAATANTTATARNATRVMDMTILHYMDTRYPETATYRLTLRFGSSSLLYFL